LVPEPTNPYDRNAVAVLIGTRQVGHLARDDAAEYTRPLTRRRQKGLPTTCRAVIAGGRRGGSYGVFLEGIPDPDELD
jgi:collagen type III alpha